jgi:hypothetical protein
VQLLFATGKSFTVDGLREKLREFFRQEVRPELRAVAALNNVELITALISFDCQLGLVGLQLRIRRFAITSMAVRMRNYDALDAERGSFDVIGSPEVSDAIQEALEIGKNSLSF